MSLRLHPFTKACLWCSGIATAWNGALCLLWLRGSPAFHAWSFLNIVITGLLAVPLLCLVPSLFFRSVWPGHLAVDHLRRPRVRDLLAGVVAALVMVICVYSMARFLAVSEDPLRRRIQETWPPENSRPASGEMIEVPYGG